MSFIIQEIPTPAVFGINTTEPTGAGGTITFEVGSQDELFFEGNASSNFGVNVIYDPTTSLDVAMQDNDIVNISLKVKNGAVPYALTDIKIDGTGSGISIAYADNVFPPLTGVTGEIANYDLQITKRQPNTFDVFVGKSDEYSEFYDIPPIPTNASATYGTNASSISVSFTGASAGVDITYYEALSSPSGITATNSASPIVLTGLTSGTSYTFEVRAYGPGGFSDYSNPTNAIAPTTPAGQQAYTTPGTYTWTAPPGVTNVSIVAVGGGGAESSSNGAGAGGGLAYKNNITVVPGTGYTVIVGAGGTNFGGGGFSRFTASYGSTTAGGGGVAVFPSTPGAGGAPSGVFDGGGTGGISGVNSNYAGGGGAGGYSGNGGAGDNSGGTTNTDGAGGGGGGGIATNPPGGGGGVGILGQGSNGLKSTVTGKQGGGGSGGGGGAVSKDGALYGGGGTKDQSTGSNVGGGGAVRIIWPGGTGITRAFPSTNTGDL